MSFKSLIFSSLFATLAVAKPIQSLQSRAAVSVLGYDYAGCYTDIVGDRTLSAKDTAHDAMTIEKCAAFCSGYTWFGLEYGRECFCGNAVKTGSTKVQEAYCSFACSGDASQTCGAGNHLTTYARTGTVPASTGAGPTTYGSQGCYTEPSGGRALTNIAFTDPAMTVEKCAAKCSGFPLFGLEYHSECYCGLILQDGSQKVSHMDCPYKCAGDKTQSCGGDWRLNLYEFGADPVVETIETRYSSQGCYKEAYTSPLGQRQRSLLGKSIVDSQMTVETCAATCAGYIWFGLEYGTECYCGMDLTPGSVATDAADCRFSCPGDATQKCGAGDRLNLYKFGAPVLPSSTTSSISSTTTISTSTSVAPTTTSLITTSYSSTSSTTSAESSSSSSATSTAPVASCTVFNEPFKITSTSSSGEPQQLVAQLSDTSGHGSWELSSALPSWATFNTTIWTFDNNGFLRLAYENSPLDASASKYEWYPFTRSPIPGDTEWPPISPKSLIDTWANTAYIKGCVDRVTGELRLNALGRETLLECDRRWFAITTEAGRECIKKKAFVVPLSTTSSSTTASPSPIATSAEESSTSTTTTPSPATTSTTTTTSLSSLPTCVIKTEPFRIQATNLDGVDHLLRAIIQAPIQGQITGEGYNNWLPLSESSAQTIQDTIIWTFDNNGRLKLANKKSGSTDEYYYAYMKTMAVEDTTGTNLAPEAHANYLVTNDLAAYITGCVDTSTFEVKLNVLGRDKVVACDRGMFMTSSNGGGCDVIPAFAVPVSSSGSSTTTALSSSATSTSLNTAATTTTTSSTPLPTFQIQFASPWGGNPYTLTIQSKSANDAYGVWEGDLTQLEESEIENSTTFTFDESGNLKLAYKRLLYSTEDWYVYSLASATGQTTMPKFSPKEMVDLLSSDNSGYRVKGFVDAATGEVKLNSEGRQNILMCQGKFYLSSGSGQDAFKEIEHPCIQVRAFINLPTSSSTSTSGSPSSTTTMATTTMATTTSSTPSPTCVASTEPFQIQSTSSFGGATYNFFADIINEYAVNTKWEPASTIDSPAMLNKATFSFDSSGNLKLANKFSGEDWYPYALLDQVVTARIVNVARKVDLENMPEHTFAYVKGCVDIVTGELRLDSMGRKEVLECYAYTVISNGINDSWGDPTPCNNMQVFAVPVVSSGSSATTSTSSSVTSISTTTATSTTATSSTPIPTYVADTFQIRSDTDFGPYILSIYDGESGYAFGDWMPAHMPASADTQNRTTFTFDASGNLKLAYKRTSESEEDWYAYTMDTVSTRSDTPMFSPKSLVDLLTSGPDGGARVTGSVDVATREVKLKSVERQNLLYCWGSFFMSVGLGEDVDAGVGCTKMEPYAVATQWIDYR